MKTDSAMVSVAPISDIIEQARRAQRQHIARLAITAARALRQIVSRALFSDGVGSASRLRLH